jgi:hypothetical protein
MAVTVWLLPSVSAAQPVLFVRTQEFLQPPLVSAIDLATGTVTWQESIPGAEKLAVTADGHYLLVVTTSFSGAVPTPSSAIVARNLATRETNVLPLGQVQVLAMAVHPRRLEAYVHTVDALWRATPAGLSALEGCDRPSAVAVAPDGGSLATVCGPPGGAEITLIDTSQWAITRRIPSVTGYVGSPVLDRDAGRVFVSEGGDVAVYDVASGSRIAHGMIPPPPAGYSLSLTGATRSRNRLFAVASRYTVLDDPVLDRSQLILESHLRYGIDPSTLVRQTLPGGLSDVQVETMPDDRFAIFASASAYFASLLQLVDLLTDTERARAYVIGPSRSIAVALAAPPLPPAAFASLVAGRRVDLSWSLPDTSPDAVRFVIEVGSRAGAADLARLTVDGTARALTVPGVPPGRYWVRIGATNYTGTSASSDEIVIEVR